MSTVVVFKQLFFAFDPLMTLMFDLKSLVHMPDTQVNAGETVFTHFSQV